MFEHRYKYTTVLCLFRNTVRLSSFFVQVGVLENKDNHNTSENILKNSMWTKDYRVAVINKYSF